MQKRHLDRRQYFDELVATSQKYLLPFIEQTHPVTSSTRVLEIGCGEGGNLLPFARRGCSVVGIELSQSKIDDARAFFKAEGHGEATLIASDIFEIDPARYPADLIILHDVIEHIEDKQILLDRIGQFLAPQGVVFIGFPAWQMPFGGHQQICHSILSKIPFIHLLPKSIYKTLLRMFGENDATIDEMLYIKRTRTTIENFLRIVKKGELNIVKRRFYFINPHYEIKFGLKPRKLLSIISRVPWLRNFFCTSCFFILTK